MGSETPTASPRESEAGKALDYVPILYRRRSSNAASWTIFTGVAAGTMAWLDWRHSAPAIWVQGLIVAVPAALAAGNYLLGKGTECRIEGDQFWFVTARVPATSVPVMDILAITQVSDGDRSHVEIAVRHKGRMKVDPETYFRVKSLEVALLAINPAIRFGRRSAASCGCCGASLLPAGRSTSMRDVMRLIDGGQCPECHRLFPRLGEFVE